MNTPKILASAVIALASLAAGSAFADTLDQHYPVAAPTTSTVSRAQVQAELAQAQKDGSLSTTTDYGNYPVLAETGTSKTRAEVQAELIKARNDGSIPVFRS